MANNILVVQSKVKEMIKKKGHNCAGDVADALSKEIERLVKGGIDRAKANGRKTVRGNDV